MSHPMSRWTDKSVVRLAGLLGAILVIAGFCVAAGSLVWVKKVEHKKDIDTVCTSNISEHSEIKSDITAIKIDYLTTTASVNARLANIEKGLDLLLRRSNRQRQTSYEDISSNGEQ